LEKLGDRDRGRNGVESHFLYTNDEKNCGERNDRPMSRKTVEKKWDDMETMKGKAGGQKRKNLEPGGTSADAVGRIA